MGAKGIRTLVFAVAVAAGLPALATASFYNHDGRFEVDLAHNLCRWCYIGFISGDSTGVGIPYFDQSGNDSCGVSFDKVDSEGRRMRGGEFWCAVGSDLTAWIHGFILFEANAVCAFDVYYFDVYKNRYIEESYLVYAGWPSPRWVLKEEGRNWFGPLARTPDGRFFYCVRHWQGDYRICKMISSGVVVSNSSPLGLDPKDIAATDNGVVFANCVNAIYKLRDTGSILASWTTPASIRDVSMDGAGRVLALGENNYVYVYKADGTLLGSFTGPYTKGYRFGDVGPGGKYFTAEQVETYNEYFWYTEVHRFAPSPTNITPTSLGKIKAMYR
jgi:hypothetical protein